MKKKFAIAFVLSIVIFTLLYSTILNSLFTERAAVASPEVGEKENNVVEKTEEKKPKSKDEILFLLMGVDANSVKDYKGVRTDTIMLFRVNFDTGSINLLSIPRDTRVTIKGALDKINHAHSYGGPDLTIKTIKDFLGIDLEYYVRVDYQVVKDIVNAINGIEIDVPFDMVYTADPTIPINIKKGKQILKGDKAHEFLRFRSGYPEGDIGRIKAQQYFMKELVKQTLDAKNIFKLPQLIETYFKNVETNIPLSAMLKGATSAKKIDTENLITNTIPGYGKVIGNVDYWIYDREKTDKIVKEMFGDYIN